MVAKGDDGIYLSSDSDATGEDSREFYRVKHGEICAVDSDTIIFFDASGKEIRKSPEDIYIKRDEYSKGDYIVKHGDNFRQVKSDELVSTETQSYYYQEYVISTGLQAETKFTSAILKVFSDVPIVYYSTGFGEAPISNFQVVKTYIEGSGFDVKPIDLKSEDFDEKAVSIIFFGPTNDLSGEAEHKLGRWLEYGGDEFLMVGEYVDEQQIEEAIQTINKRLEEKVIQMKFPYPLKAGIGYFIVNANEKLDLSECLKKADEAMYLMKKRQHEEMKKEI